MGILKKISTFMDEHEREIAMGELGLIGMLAGYILTDPKVEVKVNDWAANQVKKAVSNVHITYGERKPITISGGGDDKRPTNYWDYLDRREQREHEERMAEMKIRQAIYAEDCKVE